MLGLEAAAPSNGPSSPSSRVRSGQDMLLVQWLGVEDDRVSRLHATIQVHWGTGRRPPLVSIEVRPYRPIWAHEARSLAAVSKAVPRHPCARIVGS